MQVSVGAIVFTLWRCVNDVPRLCLLYTMLLDQVLDE